ncbi:hypothetical protein ACEQPO_12590 [Bacillus sp. SL00103]
MPVLAIRKPFQIHCSTCSSIFACIPLLRTHKEKDGKEYFYLLELQHVDGEMKTFTLSVNCLTAFISSKALKETE